MEAHGTAEVDPSLRSPGVGRGLEGALAASCPLRDIPEERHLLQNRSSVMFYLICERCISLIGGNGLAICSSRGLDIIAKNSRDAPFFWLEVSGTVGLRGTTSVRCQLLKRRNDKAVSKYLQCFPSRVVQLSRQTQLDPLCP